jgi:hypothetical protein
MRIVNWFGLAAGIFTLVMLAVSLFMPWWRLTIGSGLFNVDASPVATNFGLMGDQFNIPLIWALNLSSILAFTACGIVMLIYSVMPTKPYAIHLLGFSWKKPLYALVFFTVGLVAIVAIAGYFGVTIPLMGTGTLTIPDSLTFGMGLNFNTVISGQFLLPFWFGLGAAILCVAARVYHTRLPCEDQSSYIPPPP